MSLIQYIDIQDILMKSLINQCLHTNYNIDENSYIDCFSHLITVMMHPCCSVSSSLKLKTVHH